MLAKDKERLSAVHDAIGPRRTPYTESGQPAYYLDANGRQSYADWEQMQRYHPCPAAPWQETRDGGFPLDDSFYERRGAFSRCPTTTDAS